MIFFIDAKRLKRRRALFFLDFLHGFSPWESGASGDRPGTFQEIATALRDDSIPHASRVGDLDLPCWSNFSGSVDFPSIARYRQQKHDQKTYNPRDMSVLTAIHLRNKQWKLINIEAYKEMQSISKA